MSGNICITLWSRGGGGVEKLEMQLIDFQSREEIK
jgi:hypothetical protein